MKNSEINVAIKVYISALENLPDGKLLKEEDKKEISLSLRTAMLMFNALPDTAKLQTVNNAIAHLVGYVVWSGKNNTDEVREHYNEIMQRIRFVMTLENAMPLGTIIEYIHDRANKEMYARLKNNN